MEPPECDANRNGKADDDNDDIYGLVGCYPPPRRFIWLKENSNSRCIDDYGFTELEFGCEQSTLINYIEDEYTLQRLETYSVEPPWSDLERARSEITGGDGHTIVYSSPASSALLELFGKASGVPGGIVNTDSEIAEWLEKWRQNYAFFSDRSRFPDGVTFWLNTQPSLFDECLDPGGSHMTIPAAWEERIKEVNQALVIDLALTNDNVVAIDLYPDFLGHADRANVGSCPNCTGEKWFRDLVHINELGFQHIGEKWKVAVDLMYGENCR